MTADVKTGGDAQAAPKEAQAFKFSGYQKFIVALLAFLQFSIILRGSSLRRALVAICSTSTG
jgi:hypothetical protein